MGLLFMSMVVCLVAQAAIYMAADSRQYPSGADTVQKVFLVGRDAMLGHSGIGLIPSDGPSGGTWDAAKEVGRIAASTPMGTFQEQLAFIQREVLKSFNTGLQQRSGEINGDHPHLAIMFVKRDSNGQGYCTHQVFSVVSTPLENQKWSHWAEAVPAEPPRTSGIWWDAPSECPVSLNSRAGPIRAALSAFIQEVAEQSDYCRQVIGGAIRIAVADDMGARWIPE